MDTLPGTKKLENLKTVYLTMNREPNREVQAWTSWLNQEVIGFTGKLLFFHSKLTGFCQEVTGFYQEVFFIYISYHSW